MITLKNLTKTYNSNNLHQVKALQGITLTLPEKGFVFVVGKSGSGKSTLLHILGGLDKHDSGELSIHQKSLNTFKAKDYDYYRNSKIGFIFQEYNLIESFTVKENIEIAAKLQNKKISDEELLLLLSKVDLSDLSTRLPSELSGGQRQRIAIARALVKNPDIILADEPTGSLDDETSTQIFDLLKSLSKDKLVIVVSHDLEFAKRYADRIIELKDGYVVSDTNPVLENHFNSMDHSIIKSHFSIWNAIPFAIKDFLSKPMRMMIMILILSISFILFGLSHTISSYQIENAASQSMEISEINYVSLNQELLIEYSGSIYQMHPNISEDTLNRLKNIYSEQYFFPIYQGFTQTYRNFLYESYTSNFSFEDFTGGIELTDQLISEFDLELIAGSYPNITSSPMEIAISYRVFEVFQSNGFSENNLKTIINTPSDMIGKIITIQGINYQISGVIDTHYDDSRYLSVYNQMDSSIGYDILYNELYSLNQNSIHNLVFLGSGYQNQIIEHTNRQETYDGEVEFRLFVEESSMSGLYHSNHLLSKFKTVPNFTIWKDGITRTSLESNEILIPIDMIPLDQSINGLVPFGDQIEDLVQEHIESFAIQEFDDIKNEFDANFPGDNTYLDYIYYINHAFNNDFHDGYTFGYFYNISRNQIVTEHYFIAFESILLQGIQMFYTKEYVVEVVGFYNYTDFRGSNNQDVIILSNDLFDEMFSELFLYDYQRILVKTSNDSNQNSEFISEVMNQSGELSMVISNEVIGTLYYMDELLQQISVFTFYFGLLFAAFASILLYGYISIMIGNREKDIGILRALGAKKTDIMKIFVFESLSIGFIAFLLASIGGFIINQMINYILIRDYNLIITILDFGMIQILIIFLMSFIVSLMSSILPLYRLSLRKPIDVIKGI